MSKSGFIKLVGLFLMSSLSLALQGPNLNEQLYEAVESNKTQSVKELIAQGADVNYKSPLSLSTPLHEAVDNNNLPLVSALLKAGSNPNTEDWQQETPLFKALYTDESAPVLAELIAHGAQANLTDRHTKTPLNLAAQRGLVSIAQELIKGGADINKREFGQTALHQAAKTGNLPLVKVLLAANADTHPKHSRSMGCANCNRNSCHTRNVEKRA